MNTLNRTAASVALVAALALAGCGGGGGGEQQNSGTTPAAPAPTPTPDPTPPTPRTENFNLWLSGVIASPADGGEPVDMDALTFVFDANTDAYDSLFVGLE
jgi:hypothetical protein